MDRAVSTVAEPAPVGSSSTSAASCAPDLSRRDYVRLLRRLTLVLVGVGLMARIVRYALDAGLWGDEAAVGLNILGRDYAGLTRTLDWRQVAPILFLWVERTALLLFGSSEWSLRLLPFLFGIGGLLVFWDFARRVVPPTAAMIAVGVMAVARWPVFMSGTLKPYTADMFWSALLLALAARWRQRPEQHWSLAALIAVVPLALGFSYPSVFVAGGVSVALLPAIWQRGDRRATTLFACYNLLLLSSFAAVYGLMLSQKADPQAADLDVFMRAYWAHGFPPTDPLTFPGWFLAIHTGRMMSFPIGDGHGGSTLPFLLFVLGVCVTWRARNRGLLALCLTPFVLNLVAAVAQRYPYGACTRLSMHLSPAICLMIGVGWARTTEAVASRLQRRARWVAAIAILLVMFAVAQMVYDIAHPHHDPAAKWAQAISRELDRHMQPGDRIVYISATSEKIELFEWYMARLGDRVLHDTVPTAPPGRIWLVILTAHRPGTAEEAEWLATLGPGWDTLARADYLVRLLTPPDYLHCTVRCLARPEDSQSRPQLQASP